MIRKRILLSGVLFRTGEFIQTAASAAEVCLFFSGTFHPPSASDCMWPEERPRKGRFTMKKIIALLTALILLTASAATAQDKPADIQSMTALGEIREKLDQGVQIGKVYYTDGYGFSTSEFTTDDPEEIEQLWEAVNAITVGEKVNESITDWYPEIVFCLTDGTQGRVSFEAKWLCAGMDNYEIGNAEGFWNLTAALVEKHAAMAAGAVRVGRNEAADGGWGTASDPAITDEVRALFDKAMKGLVGVNYVPVAYLGSQVVAGCSHAVLCQATTVYPGAAPRWVIVYLFEDLDGGVTITDIRDLNW